MNGNLANTWETLQDVYRDDSDELQRIFNKLLAGKLSEYRQQQGRYRRDIAEFESKYQMESASFYAQFEQGQMGDDMDFFEWAGMWELYQKVSEKIARLQGQR